MVKMCESNMTDDELNHKNIEIKCGMCRQIHVIIKKDLIPRRVYPVITCQYYNGMYNYFNMAESDVPLRLPMHPSTSVRRGRNVSLDMEARAVKHFYCKVICKWISRNYHRLMDGFVLQENLFLISERRPG